MLQISKYDKILHSKIHIIDVFDRTGFSEKRSLEIILKCDSDGTLLIKVRDINTFSFNYTTVIRKNNFLDMRREQSLDIEFEELSLHFLEMLSSNLSGEMQLKCEIHSGEEMKCNLIFFERMKIKSLIFLTITLLATNQREVLEELELHMKGLQEINNNLKRQLNSNGEKLLYAENEIVKHKNLSRVLEQQFLSDVQNVNKVFTFSLRKCETLLEEKITKLFDKIKKVISDFNIVKKESYLKTKSSTRLLHSMENLRIESLENTSVITKLKKDCSKYEKLNKELEDQVFHLVQTKDENEKKISELQNKTDEYKRDLESSIVALKKKNDLENELKEDMIQAHKIIASYSQHYDLKAQEVEELKKIIKSKDELIKEQIFENNDLFKNFHEYKATYNVEETEKLLAELSTTKERLDILEKEKREMVKLNGLLTKKISATNIFNDL